MVLVDVDACLDVVVSNPNDSTNHDDTMTTNTTDDPLLPVVTSTKATSATISTEIPMKTIPLGQRMKKTKKRHSTNHSNVNESDGRTATSKNISNDQHITTDMNEGVRNMTTGTSSIVVAKVVSPKRTTTKPISSLSSVKKVHRSSSSTGTSTGSWSSSGRSSKSNSISRSTISTSAIMGTSNTNSRLKRKSTSSTIPDASILFLPTIEEISVASGSIDPMEDRKENHRQYHQLSDTESTTNSNNSTGSDHNDSSNDDNNTIGSSHTMNNCCNQTTSSNSTKKIDNTTTIKTRQGRETTIITNHSSSTGSTIPINAISFIPTKNTSSQHQPYDDTPQTIKEQETKQQRSNKLNRSGYSKSSSTISRHRPPVAIDIDNNDTVYNNYNPSFILESNDIEEQRQHISSSSSLLSSSCVSKQSQSRPRNKKLLSTYSENDDTIETMNDYIIRPYDIDIRETSTSLVIDEESDSDHNKHISHDSCDETNSDTTNNSCMNYGCRTLFPKSFFSIRKNQSSTSSHASHESTVRNKCRIILYMLVAILVSSISILSTIVVLQNHSSKNNTSTNNSNSNTTNNLNQKLPAMNVSSTPSSSLSSPAVPVIVPTRAPITTMVPVGTNTQTSSPIITLPIPTPELSVATIEPSSSSSDDNKENDDDTIPFIRKAPLLYLNCGGPTINMISTRSTMNRNNETVIRNVTRIWESDAYYKEYQIGDSRMISKYKVDTCQNYVFPNETSKMKDFDNISITTIDDRTLDALFCTERYFTSPTSGYEIPVTDKPGYYRIEMHFMESYHNDIGQRIFTISIENEIQELDFDIYAAANGRNKKVTLANTVFVSDGSISIAFNATVNYPLLNALSILYLVQDE
jgi:hypothetical protein